MIDRLVIREDLIDLRRLIGKMKMKAQGSFLTNEVEFEAHIHTRERIDGYNRQTVFFIVRKKTKVNGGWLNRAAASILLDSVSASGSS